MRPVTRISHLPRCTHSLLSLRPSCFTPSLSLTLTRAHTLTLIITLALHHVFLVHTAITTHTPLPHLQSSPSPPSQHSHTQYQKTTPRMHTLTNKPQEPPLNAQYQNTWPASLPPGPGAPRVSFHPANPHQPAPSVTTAAMVCPLFQSPVPHPQSPILPLSLIKKDSH